MTSRHYEMTILIDIDENDVGEIEIRCESEEFIPWMMAAEYLTFVTAQMSHAGLEGAMELIQKGALKYKTVRGRNIHD